MAARPDSLWELFRLELRRVPAERLTHERVEFLLRSVAGGQRLYVPTRDDDERIAFAARQLRMGAERFDLMQRLRGLYGISRAQGYRIIAQALAQATRERAGREQARTRARLAARGDRIVAGLSGGQERRSE